MSSRKIEDCVSDLQERFKLFEVYCQEENLQFVVTCTTRTLEEQKELVKAGKSRTLKSKHITGEAFDIAVIKNGKPVWDYDSYVPFGHIGKLVGLTWGGNWKTFRDACHFQIGG